MTLELERRIADYERLERKDWECDNPFSAHLVREMLDESRVTLVAEGDALVPTLMHLLSKSEMTSASMSLLCALDRSASVVKGLFRALEHSDSGVRRRAISRLGALGVIEVFERLAPLSVSNDDELAATVWSLLVLDAGRAMPLVEDLAGAKSLAVRRALADGAARAAFAPLLQRLADDPDWLVRHTCLIALYHCDPTGWLTRARERLGGGHSGDVCLHLISIGAGTIPRESGWDTTDLGDALFPSLAGLSFATRAFVVRALIPHRTVSLIDLLFHGPSIVGLEGRARLETTLGSSVRRAWWLKEKTSLYHDKLTCLAGFLTREETVETILSGFASTDSSDMEQALELTDTLMDPRIVEAMARSPSWTGSQAIALAMAPYGTEALKALERACRTATRQAHIPIQRLRHLPLQGAQAMLERLAMDRSVAGRRDAIKALGERGPSAVLVRLSRDETDPLQRDAALALQGHTRPSTSS